MDLLACREGFFFSILFFLLPIHPTCDRVPQIDASTVKPHIVYVTTMLNLVFFLSRQLSLIKRKTHEKLLFIQ